MMARNGEECFVSGGARGGGKNGRTDGQKRPDGTSRGTINLRPAVCAEEQPSLEEDQQQVEDNVQEEKP